MYYMRMLIDERRYDTLEEYIRTHNVRNNYFSDYLAVTYACSTWNTKGLSILLRAGARVQDTRQPTRFRDTAMYHALKTDAVVVTLLMKHGYSFRNLDLQDGSPAEMLLWSIDVTEEVIEIVLSAYIGEKYNPVDRNNIAPSHLASHRGKVESLKRFLEFDNRAVNLKIREDYDKPIGGMCPLHLAMMNEQIDKVKLLLDYGADVFALNDKFRTPLHDAAYGKNKAIVELLFKYVDLPTRWANPMDTFGITIFHIACWMGPVEIVKEYIRLEEGIVHKTVEMVSSDNRNHTYLGYTPLHFAVLSGDIEKIQLLILRGAKINAESLTDKVTPLGLAVKNNYKLVIDVLKRELCSQNAHSVEHDIGFELLYEELFKCESVMDYHPPSIVWDTLTPLHYAVTRRDVELVERLLRSGANVNARDDRGLTPLMMACILTQRTARLLKGIAGVPSRSHELRQKTFEWLTRDDSQQSRIFNLLLEYKANVNAVDENGKTALVYLTINSLFLWLNTAITEPVRKRLAKCCRRFMLQLLQHGAAVQFPSRDGTTLLHHACRMKHYTDLFVLNEDFRIKLAKLCLKAGCDVNTKSDDGSTALYLAVCNNFFDLAEVLIEHGADIHAATNTGETLLHAVTGTYPSNIRERFITYLLSLGVNVKAVTLKKSTILHYAVRQALNQDSDTLVRTLLEHGVDVNAQDQKGMTALHYAVSTDNGRIMEALLSHDANVDIEDNNGRIAFACSKLMHIIIILVRHIKCMKALGYTFSPKNELFITKFEKKQRELNFDDYKQSVIENEIERLKAKAVNSKTAMYDLLFKSVFELRHYVGNDDFVQYVFSNSFIGEFNHFGPIIQARMKRTVVRGRLLEAAKALLVVVTSTQVPEIIMDTILKYLCNWELTKLINCCMEDPLIRAEINAKREEFQHLQLKSLLMGECRRPALML